MGIPKRVRSRLSTEVRRYQKILEAAKNRDVNESDTVVIVADFLSDVLGFGKYDEITTEFSIRGTYCDLAIKTGGRVRFLVEAKAIGIRLKERHLRQAIGYAATHGIEWVVLTNGAEWLVYRMRFEKPVSSDQVLSIDLLSTPARDPELISHLYLLSREGLSKSAIEEFQEHKDACNPVLISAVLRSDRLVSALRRELRRVTPGARIDDVDIRSALENDVIKRELLDCEEARVADGRVRRAAGTRLKKRREITRMDRVVLSTNSPSETPLRPESDLQRTPG